MVDIRNTLSELAKDRPIFHSEADFQHALAWRLHQDSADWCIRLEYPVLDLAQRIYLDMWAKDEGMGLGIELKYKTRGLRTEVGGEQFHLLDQAAQPIGRYDFLKDIERLEQVVPQENNAIGYAILLTNDSAYWKLPMRRDSVDPQFRLNEGNVITGELKWEEGASQGTRRGREEAIHIAAEYELRWHDYSTPVPYETYGTFRYLAVEVASDRIPIS